MQLVKAQGAGSSALVGDHSKTPDNFQREYSNAAVMKRNSCAQVVRDADPNCREGGGHTCGGDVLA